MILFLTAVEVSNRVSLDSVMGLICFIIFINDIGKEMEYVLVRKFS